MSQLKIAVIADPFIPVPPTNYGGIERIVDFLVTGLTEKGHEVILLAHEDSKVDVKLIPYGKQDGKLKHFNNILRVNDIKKFKPDVIHSFGRLAYLIPFLYSTIPKIMSYQREPTISQIKKAMLLAKKNTIAFTGCSAYISNQILPFAPANSIFNGVNLAIYDFAKDIAKDAPLVFLGRIEPIKGTHIAIKVALATNKKLVIAGNIPDEYTRYFEQEIKPHLSEKITYIGPVNDLQKNKLLGNALAFLMPIEWNEPFGIVMAEAMACGTPIIGFNKGSVPEVIINGINGYRCDTLAEMISAVTDLETIDRKKVREDAENRFSSKIIISQYLNLYQSMINNL
ncbi:glycosyltransferase involved in cell wall biosynthesis [Pedobacter psychrotolerans]|uniref:Glycosyl transferase n=1 Tax=Pedobacter psychrotolerans TaxID=1843235 RepID=A0A4R2HL53_9SPHI|nr:glycosyltransferase family 4 protein [Pedobacter psychrotolerans]TCO30790.1 glycosyltransferase involved in cell wall biosynthesis [Pedobacter psychrotolerans]GGE44398.1 glycosyl transferase [Pedobacter psychrotolerans]